MKKKFMHFLETLSRDEMRTITGGCDGGCGTCHGPNGLISCYKATFGPDKGKCRCIYAVSCS
jgi:hypothetical protein